MIILLAQDLIQCLYLKHKQNDCVWLQRGVDGTMWKSARALGLLSAGWRIDSILICHCPLMTPKLLGREIMKLDEINSAMIVARRNMAKRSIFGIIQ